MLTKYAKFGVVVKEWLLFKRISVKKSTYYRYKYIVDKYILSYLRNKRIYNLIHYDFNFYIKELSESLSNETVKNVLIILKSILKYVETKYNLDLKLYLICLPKKKKEDIKILNKEEIKIIENYCYSISNNFKGLGIQLSLSTGMRIGEICGLKWKNIDLKNGFVLVKKTLQRVYTGNGQTKVLIDDPKSSTSIRKIPIPKKLLKNLKRIYFKNNFNGEEFVLSGKTDSYVEPRTLERYLEKILKDCKIRYFKFHTLRHTYATNCIKLGMDPKSLSILLGHSDIKITLEKYVHPNIEEQRKYIDLL